MEYSASETIMKFESGFKVTVRKNSEGLIIEVLLVTNSPDPNSVNGRSMQEILLEIATEYIGRIESNANIDNHRFVMRNGLVEEIWAHFTVQQ